MDAARRSADPDTAYAAALEATIDLVAETSALTSRETAGFFENIRFPEMPAGSGGGPSRVRSAG